MTTPIYQMADTWNNAGVSFNAIKMDVTDTASLPTSKLFDVQVGGVSRYSVDKDGLVEAGNGTLLSDMAELWDNAGTIYSAIKMNVTNTASNDLSKLLHLQVDGADKFVVNRDGFIDWTTSAERIAIERKNNQSINAEGGTHFFLATGEVSSGDSPSLIMSNSTGIVFRTNNASRWDITKADGHLTAATDDAVDIGQAGANRPRHLYLAGGTVVLSNLPVADPTNAGQLWNDSGTLKVSAG